MQLYNTAKQNKTEVKRFGKFAIVGFSGLIVDFFTLNVLTYFFKVPELTGIAIAFMVAACNNFVWNRLWVYPESRNQKKRKQLPVFMAVNAIGLGINWLIFSFFNVPIDSVLAKFPIAFVASHHQGLGLNLTKAIAAVVVMFWNFVVNRLVTFRNVGKPEKSDDSDMHSAL